jgi:hypothetical protein
MLTNFFDGGIKNSIYLIAGYLPYVLFSTGGVVLALTLAGSAACLMQHVKVMSG